MSTQTALLLLQRLDRAFSAQFRSKELSALLPQTAADKLFDKGVLVMETEPDTAPCPLGEHEGDGLVAVAKQNDGSFTGFCLEHGKHVKLLPEEAEWVKFAPEAWVAALASANGLIESSQRHESGFLFAGIHRTGNRKAGVAIVSAHAQGNAHDYRPRAVEADDWLYITLDNSQPNNGERYAYIPASAAFGLDLLALDKSALGTALGQLKKAAPDAYCLKYTSGSKQAACQSEAEYQKAIASGETKKYALVVDLMGCKAWRSGKRITHMAQKKDKGRRSVLSPTGLKLLAEYLRQPRMPLSPYKVGPYLGDRDSREKKSAQTMLLNMCSTLAVKEVLQLTNNPTDTVGDGLYEFNPPAKFKYLLLAPPDNE
ncbi:MAG: hypothetical protein WC421_06560 [Elusimicrobiales bacterium]